MTKTLLDVGPSEQLHMKLHKEKPIAFCQSDGIFTNLETHACCWQMNGCKFSYFIEVAIKLFMFAQSSSLI